MNSVKDLTQEKVWNGGLEKNAEDLKVVQLPKMLKEDLKWWSNYFSSKNIEECRNGDTDQSLFASYDLTIDVCRNILLGECIELEFLVFEVIYSISFTFTDLGFSGPICSMIKIYFSRF